MPAPSARAARGSFVGRRRVSDRGALRSADGFSSFARTLHDVSVAADATKRCANCFCYGATRRRALQVVGVSLRGRPRRPRLARETRERAPDARGQKAAATVAASVVETDDKAIVSGQFSTAAILRRIERVYPEETPSPRGFRGTLRPYQRQSLAFALNRERGAARAKVRQGNLRGVHGGIIADEVGMGKTAVAIALVRNPKNSKRASDDDWANFHRVLTQKPPPPSRIKQRLWNDRTHSLFVTHM